MKNNEQNPKEEQSLHKGKYKDSNGTIHLNYVPDPRGRNGQQIDRDTEDI
ncbi:hypothetical protein [Peribacillus asahii]